MKKLFDLRTACNIGLLVMCGILLWYFLLFSASVVGATDQEEVNQIIQIEDEWFRNFKRDLKKLDAEIEQDWQRYRELKNLQKEEKREKKLKENPIESRVKALEDRVKKLEDWLKRCTSEKSIEDKLNDAIDPPDYSRAEKRFWGKMIFPWRYE